MAKAIALASLLLLVPSLADAAPPRVGVLLPGNEWTSAFDGLREGMKELGYVEGRDIGVTFSREALNRADELVGSVTK